MTKVIDKVDNSLSYIEETALVVALFICMMVLFVNVVLRSCFNFILAFPDELARYLMIYIIYLGMSIAYKKNSQLRLDLLISIFPKAEKHFNILADMISFVAILTIIVWGFAYTKELFVNKDISSVLELPLYILYGIAPLTGIFMGFRLIRSIIRNVR